MATMNVSLPDSLKEFVEAQVREGDYGTSSEFVRELIRRESAHQAACARDRGHGLSAWSGTGWGVLRATPRESPQFGGRHRVTQRRVETTISELRSLALRRFPYMVFYPEDPDAIRVHRVLHTSRDIPAELMEA